MDIGNLNKKILIYKKSESVETNEIGQPIEIKSVIGQPYAEIIPKTGSLLAGRAGDTVLSNTTHMIRIRYNKKYEFLHNSKNWVEYQDHRFEINYILNPYFKNETLEIFVSEVI